MFHKNIEQFLRAGLMVVVISAMIAMSWLPLRFIVHSQSSRKTDLKEDTIRDLPSSGKRYALIIGVDQYADTQITTLGGASNDAKSLADALVKYAGFPSDQVILLASTEPAERQPTRGNILRRLSNLKAVVPKDGLLLVSFAGHGMERDGRAYLLPTDAQVSGDLALLEETAINAEIIRNWIRQTGVGQVLMILDACRNNPAAGRGDENNSLTEAYTRGFSFDIRNREITAFATLYATEVGHVAYEYKERKQGYFTWALVEGLKGGAVNEKGEVTLAGLVKYLQETVPKRVLLDLGQGKRQRPFAVIEGYKADDLVIAITDKTGMNKTMPGVQPTDPAALELEFWKSIENSSDPKDFKAYFDEYPNGRFARLAKNRLESLEAASRPPFPTTSTGTQPSVTNVPPPATSSAEPAAGAGVDLALSASVVGQFVRIPAGEFMMGSTNGDSDEKPVHRVRISQSFEMGKYEVTQAQWEAVMGSNPSYFKGADLPVENVSWEEVQQFIEKLNSRSKKYNYRLPTEAEWEYACRAGSSGDYAGDLGSMAWYKSNSGNKTHPVGQKKPNAWGLYDMHGNVWEWCQDWYGSYPDGEVTDPQGPSSGSGRVLRGGSWNNNIKYSNDKYCRSASRIRFVPGNRGDYLGFRLVRTAR